jgi:hypothetical protein
MRKAALAVAVAVVCLAGQACAEEVVIGAAGVPLYAGAAKFKSGTGAGENSRVVNYSVRAQFDKVVAFYEQFFKDQGYTVLGGKGENTYNVSVKKGEAMFALNIFMVADDTIIQLVW